jgi:hypothetical protein
VTKADLLKLCKAYAVTPYGSGPRANAFVAELRKLDPRLAELIDTQYRSISATQAYCRARLEDIQEPVPARP